jgi:hypothetical protein|tara:strand:+ start:347 stop:1126 length:780 start_codon:yes stop_codon:yes gene_type:complete
MFPSKKIQINYVMKAAEIMLLYCYEKKKKKKFINLINEDCDIYRKTDLYNIKKNNFHKRKKIIWKKITIKLEIFSKLNKKKFIIKSLQLLKFYFLQRITKNRSLIEYNTKAKFGCFSYSIIKNKVDLHMPVFQFINHKKIIKKYTKNQKFNMRAEDLIKLVKSVNKKHPNVKIIQMGSWMNQYQPFKKLFPVTWKPTSKLKKKNSIAWWGQFIKSNGDINLDIYRNFKNSLKFKYQGRFYQCKILDLKKHLEKIKNVKY